jgi:hypothetical protein
MKTWWFLEDDVGCWLADAAHGTFTHDPNLAMKWPNAAAADAFRRDQRHGLWTLKATEHAWVGEVDPIDWKTRATTAEAERDASKARIEELEKALATMLRYRQTVRDCLGEAIHAGLRKGSDAPSSGPLWRAISDSRDGAWADAVAFALWGFECGLEKQIAEAEQVSGAQKS